MTVKLYWMNAASPSVRSVILTLKALGISYELKHVNLLKGEHLSDEFKKLNPQHTIPTIEDNGFIIWDSHAINAYLVNKYGKDDELYPTEPQARAMVDQRLHFDTGVLFSAVKNVTIQAYFKKLIKKMTPELTESIENAYAFVEKFLEGNPYITGNKITIADFSFATTISNMKIVAPVKSEKFPLLLEYLKRCEEKIPSLKQINDEGEQCVRTIFAEVDFEFPS